ncbi:MAG TPA: SHOCT domain-containing protein [Candidatus Wunengus sp. YC61]|uniref:SHOCT domain-containing protein n=1 Tax=Candidatus Wunengus sp. YC61 TaxID=3367698 RepID=UPI004029C099
MKIVIALLVCLGLCGCAVNSGVIKIGKDTYKVSHQAATGFVGGSGLKDAALLEASEFCASQGKSMKVLLVGGNHPPYILGNFPKVEVQFMCLDANDPRFKENNEKVNIQSEDALASKIKNLNKLLSDGLITKGDFEEQKKKLLNDYTNKQN